MSRGALLTQAAGNHKQPPGQWGKLVDRKGYAFPIVLADINLPWYLALVNETCPGISRDVLQMGSVGMSPRWAWGGSLFLLAAWTEQEESRKLKSN